MFKNELTSGHTRIGLDVVITEIRPSTRTAGWSIIKCKQAIQDLYTPSGTNSRFFLQNKEKPAEEISFDNKRTVSLIVSNDVAEKFTVGQIIPGVNIQRHVHDSPQWEGHNPAMDGFFYTSILCEEEVGWEDSVTHFTLKETTSVVSHEENIATRTQTNPIASLTS